MPGDHQRDHAGHRRVMLHQPSSTSAKTSDYDFAELLTTPFRNGGYDVIQNKRADGRQPPVAFLRPAWCYRSFQSLCNAMPVSFCNLYHASHIRDVISLSR